MADSYSSNLRFWEGWPTAIPDGGHAAPAVQLRTDYSDHLYLAETLGPPTLHAGTPGGRPDPGGGAEPYSLQWFLDIEHLRHRRHGRWIPSVLEFAKHASETLLGLGTGLGTDWVQYARHGANVVVCCPSAENVSLVRRNFELRQLSARFLQAPPVAVPVEPASIDVVCLSDLLHRVSDPAPIVDEVYRVLKPGGKVLALIPARYDIDFWRRLLLPWQIFFRRRDAEPCVRFTGRSLRALFHRFVEHRVHKRHLRRADVPPMWRLMPTSMLQRLLGRMLVLKAFKPLSAAIPVSLAA